MNAAGVVACCVVLLVAESDSYQFQIRVLIDIGSESQTDPLSIFDSIADESNKIFDQFASESGSESLLCTKSADEPAGLDFVQNNYYVLL
jgi:hypothetical protein